MDEERNENVQAEDENQPVEETTDEVDETEEPDGESEPTEEESPEGEEVDEEPPKPREVHSMPVAKAQKEKKRAVEKAVAELNEKHKKELEEIKSQLNKGDSSPDLTEVFKKHGVDESAAKEIADAIAAGKPDLSKYDALLKGQELRDAKERVSNEFDEKVRPRIMKDYPDATPEHIEKVRGQIMELAFTEGYNTYRIEDIYTVKSGEFAYQNQSGAEAPKGHGQQLSPFKKLSDEEEIKLADTDPDAYARYLKWLEGHEGRYLN